MSPQLHKMCCDHTEIGSCFLLQGQSLSIGELQVRWKYVILIMLGILETHVLVEQKTDIIVWSHSLTQSSHNSCNCAIGQCFTCRAVLSTVSWKNIMESYCDHNSLMERCLSRSWARLIDAHLTELPSLFDWNLWKRNFQSVGGLWKKERVWWMRLWRSTLFHQTDPLERPNKGLHSEDYTHKLRQDHHLLN
jgi:hypothetical protein